MPEIRVTSEVPGKVVDIEVSVGDEVDEDDSLIVLESMKMEIPVEAPMSGKIVKVHVAEGDVVAEDQPLAVIET